MKFLSLTTILTAFGAALVSASPVSLEPLADLESRANLEPRANLPGLGKVQSSHARAIIKESQHEKLGRQGCLAAIATGLTESNLYVYANSNVKASLKIKHDKVGHDHDSVGIFQQRVMYYKNIKADMDPAKSAKQFFKKMKAIKGWKKMNVGKLCQKVQVSAFPDRYNQHLPAAKKICSAAGVH